MSQPSFWSIAILRRLLGRTVMVQFRAPFVVPTPDPGDRSSPVPLKMKASDGQEGPVMMPFFSGTFIEREASPAAQKAGQVTEIWFQFVDIAGSGKKMEVIFHPDAIFSVSVVSDDRIIAPG